MNSKGKHKILLTKLRQAFIVFLDKHGETLYNAWRIFLVFLLSFVSTCIIVFVWYKFQDPLYDFFGLDKNLLAPELGSDLIVLTPGLLYTGLQGFVLNRILGQNSRLRSAIDTVDAVAFLSERDRRTPGLVHVMLSVLTLVVISLLGLYKYCTPQVAVFAIGVCVFVAMLAFFVALELGNPFNGANRIPKHIIHKDWMTMTAEDIRDGKVKHISNGYDYKSREERLSNS